MSSLQSLCILRCLRRDKLMDGVQLFVAKEMHQKYTEPPPFDLPLCFDDSSNISAPSEYPRSETHDPALTYEAPFHSVAQPTESG